MIRKLLVILALLGLGNAWASSETLDLACGYDIAAESPILNVNSPLARLRSQGFFDAIGFSLPVSYLGGDAPVLSMGTLAKEGFRSSWDVVSSVPAGEIYQQLILRWSRWIAQDYGREAGELFFMSYANPRQDSVTPLEGDELTISDAVAKTLPTIADFARIATEDPKETHEHWETRWWRKMEAGFHDLASQLSVQKPAIDVMRDRLKGLELDLKWERVTPNYSEFSFNALHERPKDKFGEGRRPETVVLAGTVDGKTELKAQPYLLLQLNQVGMRTRALSKYFSAEVRFGGSSSPEEGESIVGAALVIKPETAALMRRDLQQISNAMEGFSTPH